VAETHVETNLRKALKDTMAEFLTRDDLETERGEMCYIGDETASAMADAAFAVLLGMADLERYFKSEKMFAQDSGIVT
jgi:uncharacterized protein (UPF0218 family)